MKCLTVPFGGLFGVGFFIVWGFLFSLACGGMWVLFGLFFFEQNVLKVASGKQNVKIN